MKVLVTGGAGFIGSNLCERLITRSYISEVRVIDDLSTGSQSRIPPGVHVRFGSILDPELVSRATQGVDTIIHLAAIPSVPRSILSPRATHDANTTGTLNILEAARHYDCQQVIVASSSSVYGSNPVMPKSEFTWTRPMSPYAVTKQATENYAIAYGFSYQMTTLAFRFFNVFGPGQAADHAYAAVIPRFIDAALRGRALTINGDGGQSRDFTYVGTLCEVIEDSIRRNIGAQDPINLAFGTNTTLLELVALLEAYLRTKLTINFDPQRMGDVRSSQADPTRLREFFPELSPVPLDVGVANTVDWFRASP